MSLKSLLILRAIRGKLPLWMYGIIGKKIARKLEGVMGEDIKQKPWYLSKAKIAAIVTVLVGAVEPISRAFGYPVEIPSYVIEVLIGIGIYGVRDAIKIPSKP